MGAGSAITPAALNRLEDQAYQQSESSARQIALTPYEYGLNPGGINPAQSLNPTAQDQHPSAQRLASGQWHGKTGMLNHAQAAEDNAPVWVTVPVDKVQTRGPVSTANEVYATPKGYVPRPGQSGGSIPPVHHAGRPLHGGAGFGTDWS